MGHNGYANFYLTDQVDSVKLVTDNDGTAITRFEYLPYGESWFTEGKQKTAPKYNSQELDKETGYYYYNARHYDPEIARFVTADSIIDGVYSTQGWNRYSYVKGNPINYSDPTGKSAGRNVYSPKRGCASEGKCGPGLSWGGGPARSNRGYGGYGAGSGRTRVPNGPSTRPIKKTIQDKVKTKTGNSSTTGNKQTKWNGPTDYGHIPDPKNVAKPQKPTPRQVREMKKANMEHNNGVLRDDVTGEKIVPSKKSIKGVKPPSNEVQVDHIHPKSKGGTRSNKNLQLRTRKNNRQKSNKTNQNEKQDKKDKSKK